MVSEVQRSRVAYLKSPYETISSDAEAEEDDEVVGTQFSLKVDGKMHEFLVQRQLDDGNYLVKAGIYERIMSSGDIFAEKEVVDRMVGHRGKGCIEVHVLWQNGTDSWEKLVQMRKDIPDVVADYALKIGITHEKKWKWADKYRRNAAIVVVTHHRTLARKLEFKVYYDGDQDAEWVGIEEVKGSLLQEYVSGKGKMLNRSPGWRKTVDKQIREETDTWFKSLQEVVSDVKRMALGGEYTQRDEEDMGMT